MLEDQEPAPSPKDAARDVLPHRRIAHDVSRHLAEDPSVDAVLLAGSVARNDHCATSDVDLLVVGSAPRSSLVRTVHGGLLVECIHRTEAEWRDRLARSGTSWAYALLDSEVLHDELGIGRALKSSSEAAIRDYVAPDALRQELATSLWHSRAKLTRAAQGSELTRGYWAAICVETVLDALYTIHDVPVPAGSRRLDHLGLLRLDEKESRLVRALLTGSAVERFGALTELVEVLRDSLGPPDHR